MEEQEEGLGCGTTGVLTLAISAAMGLVVLVVGVVLVAAIASGLAV
jgi:hypothetical protein